MAAVVDKQHGLRTDRRMSHVFVLDVKSHPKPLLVTDAAINIAPTLDEKRDIVRNAMDLAHALGIARPKVALLSAVEKVEAKIPSTIDAAALCKMADRGPDPGRRSRRSPRLRQRHFAARRPQQKASISPVAGDADILVAPELDAGNILAKQLVFLAGAETAGLALGARVPIVLTSRADDVKARAASTALAQIFAHWRGCRRTPGESGFSRS